MPKVAIVIGSASDFDSVKPAVSVLKDFNIEYSIRVLSAHRTPEDAAGFAKNAEENDFEVIIAAAGKAAHLPGVLAAYTVLPVIGLPIKSSFMDGLDSLLSIVQMPSGIPVATVAINGAENAALLAIQILSVKYNNLKEMLKNKRKEMAAKVFESDKKIEEEVR
ncbi:MAG TPA: 5-(carboxyamino)imidazole ribonucleotide mutase [Clostridia bacterium]|nr:5-(carboxyamino)imidazole ribonucleotide mutase [Clostridia bacterium]